MGRRRTMVALFVAALVLIPAAIAWACNPQASISTNKTVYSPGENVVVTGKLFVRSTNIVISLNGSTVVQNSGGAGSFRASLPAPSKTGGYTISAKRADGKYQAGLPALASIRVATRSSSGGTPNTGGSQGPSQQQQTAGQVPRNPAIQRSGLRNPTVGVIVPRRFTQNPGTAPGTGGTGGGGVVSNGAGQPAFAGSVPSQNVGTTGQGGAAEQRSANGSPSQRCATADLWSGLRTGRTPSLSGTGASASDGGPGSQLVLGVALLGLGLLALLSGFGVAQARRRRALAQYGSGR